MDFMNKLCSEFKWQSSGSLSIYDYETTLVAHTNNQVVSEGLNVMEKASDPAYEGIVDFFNNEVKVNASGVGEYKFSGEKELAGYCNLKNRGLMVVAAIDENEVYTPSRELTLFLLIISVIILVLGIIAVFFIASLIAKAIKSLKNDITKLAEYNLSAEPTHDYADRKNEIGDIYRAIQELKANFIEIIEKMKDSSKELNNSCQSFF